MCPKEKALLENKIKNYELAKKALQLYQKDVAFYKTRGGWYRFCELSEFTSEHGTIIEILRFQ